MCTIEVLQSTTTVLSEAATGGSCSGDLASKHSTCLPCVAGRPIDLPLPLRSSRTGSSDRTCQGNRRHGYRRIHVLLRREGWRVNAKRVYRLYREMGLQLRTQTSKRRVKAKRREDRQLATRRHARLPTGKPTDNAFIKSVQRQIPRARDNELVHNLLDWLPKWTTMQGNVGLKSRRQEGVTHKVFRRIRAQLSHWPESQGKRLNDNHILDGSKTVERL